MGQVAPLGCCTGPEHTAVAHGLEEAVGSPSPRMRSAKGWHVALGDESSADLLTFPPPAESALTFRENMNEIDQLDLELAKLREDNLKMQAQLEDERKVQEQQLEAILRSGTTPEEAKRRLCEMIRGIEAENTTILGHHFHEASAKQRQSLGAEAYEQLQRRRQKLQEAHLAQLDEAARLREEFQQNLDEGTQNEGGNADIAMQLRALEEERELLRLNIRRLAHQ
eukprot:gnl/TRDRNA2_/TRDRNA2_66497_c0_seq1.p1 gnl/TRDRNA2_/TRDRNA2_66497_c0~~gnl/TRDRNA2_/TRDRNA2_66497_c0_seq1.p1  ORF type:complete len:225 (+),score=64.37 gnl/TRDRNA2_/TRDRNA2_66497_c0_seq1:35-709(+)